MEPLTSSAGGMGSKLYGIFRLIFVEVSVLVVLCCVVSCRVVSCCVVSCRVALRVVVLSCCVVSSDVGRLPLHATWSCYLQDYCTST